MPDSKKVDLLVNIARLYYEHNYTQQMIAQKTGFSRPYVSKLISEARNSGIVEIIIHDPNMSESPIERELKAKFGLKKVMVVPTPENPEENLLINLSKALSRYLNLIVSDNDIIGLGWGRTLYVCAKTLTIFKEVKNVKVVQMCGALSMVDKDIFASEIPKRFADAFKGKAFLLPLPAVVDDINVKNVITQDKGIREILNLGKQANIIIYSIGVFGHDKTLSRAGYVSEQQVDEILAKGAVGDMFWRIIDRNGQICDPEFNSRTIGVELDDLKNRDYSILISGGLSKAQCIHAALNGGYANVLITDEEVAQELLKN